MHALLIVALFYGQFVSNIHVVGHLQFQEHKSHPSFVQSDCGSSPHELLHGHSLEKSPPHQHQSPTLANIDNTAEADCAIYHVLLNLNGIFWVIQNNVNVPQWPDEKESFTARIFTNIAFENQPIRAPPVIS